jgi:hypothetical protein
MAAWVFLATAVRPSPWRWGLPLAVFASGFLLTLFLAEEIKHGDLRRFRAELLQYVDRDVGRHPTATVADMSSNLDAEDEMVRRSLAKVSRAPRGSDQPKNLFRTIQAFYCRNCLQALEQLDRQGRPATVRAEETAKIALDSVPRHGRSWATVINAETVINADWPRARSTSNWRCRDHPAWQEIAGTVERAVLAEESQRPNPRKVGELIDSRICSRQCSRASGSETRSCRRTDRMQRH